jgi:hypothetical protein
VRSDAAGAEDAIVDRSGLLCLSEAEP